MTREDLLHAIGMVDEERLARCDQSRRLSDVYYLEENEMNKRFCWIKRIIFIAAVVVMTAMLMGSAIIALLSIRIEDDTIHDWNGDIHEGQEISFDESHDVFVELGPWYPHEIPEGYTMTFVSEGAPLQNQVVRYKNGSGGVIEYWIFIPDPASSVKVYDIIGSTDVDINGQKGILYEQAEGKRTQVWANEDVGFGFSLDTKDPDVDLIAMAASTAEGEPLVPTYAHEVENVLKELGDYNPTYLPEGFQEQGVLGLPLSFGSGWYSYVNKYYVNKKENTRIFFAYETYAIDENSGYTDDVKTVCSFAIPGCNILEGIIVGTEVEINGMYGIAADENVAWADPENHVLYYLCSKDVTGAELLKVAQSIDIG